MTPSQLGNLQMWNNHYYVKDSVVTSAFSASRITLSGTRVAFPVFQAAVTANSLNVFGFSLTPGSALKVSQFPMVKVLDASTARQFTLATSVAQLTSGEGRFAIAHNGVILGAETTLQPSLSYTILFSIRDNGNYDLDSTAGSILDPCVGVMSSTSSGGGGCSVALFPSAILLGVPAIFLFRKRG
jgi:Synergist-CTERM protein sorting domain-containing protein